jgi:hypothetical protein
MSASLIVLIPLVLVVLVGALCFVGCGFPTSGIPYDGGQYESVIFTTPGLVALWPLNDQTFGGTNIPSSAADRAPKPPNVKAFDGQYQGTLNSSFKLNQPSLVPGETSSLGPACAFFNGTDGFVSVPFHQELNPGSFTLEVWVKPGWSPTEASVQRAVLVSATAGGVGFGLFARPDNFWEVQIGTGGGNFASVKATQAIVLNADTSQNPVNYLAVTFDNSVLELKLFVGTLDGALNPSGPSMATLVAEDSSTSTPLFIGMGRPDVPGGMFPFKGFIQDVAVYNVPLDFQTLQGHLLLGITPPADT